MLLEKSKPLRSEGSFEDIIYCQRYCTCASQRPHREMNEGLLQRKVNVTEEKVRMCNRVVTNCKRPPEALEVVVGLDNSLANFPAFQTNQNL